MSSFPWCIISRFIQRFLLVVGLLIQFPVSGQVTPQPSEPPILAYATVGVPFIFQVPISSGATGYYASGLPAGLTMDSMTGLITGTPTTAGTNLVSLTVVDPNGFGFLQRRIVVEQAAPPVITSGAMASALVGQLFSYQITARNSPTNYSYGATGLPSGLTLGPTNGLISGIPTVAGVHAITLTVSNAVGHGSQILTLTVSPPPPPVITSALTTVAVAGKPFAYRITTTNVTTSYGAIGLPDGLSVDALTGAISGRPSVPGTNNVTLLASNAGGTGTQPLTLIVTPRPQDFLWAQSAGILGYFVRPHSVATDGAGHVYLAGYVDSTVASDGALPVTNSAAGPFVAKINGAGTVVWMFVGTATEYSPVNGIAVDASGNACVIGSFHGTLRLGANTLSKPPGDWDVFITKLDMNGNVLWAKQAGGSGQDLGNSAAVDAGGNLYVTGYFRDTSTFGTTNLVSDGGFSDAFVAKLDGNGDYLWVRQAGGSDWNPPNAVAADASGHVYLAGSFQSATASFGSITLTNVGVNRHGYIARLDPGGNYLWANLAGSSFEDATAAVAVDADGNAYIAGAFRSTAVFGATTLVSPNVYSRAYIAKCNTTGQFTWARQVDGLNFDHHGASCVASDGAGGVYLGGTFAGIATFGFTSLSSSAAFNTRRDAFIAKLDVDGSFLWARQIGTDEGSDYVSSVAVDRSSGNAYLTGHFYRTAMFDSTTLTRTGQPVAFLTKLGNFTNAPQIVGQPSDVIVIRTNGQASSPAELSVNASSGDSFQWRFNGVAIQGATNSILSLSDARRTNSGIYSVEVSGPLGAVASSNAVLRVLAQTQFLPPVFSADSHLLLRFGDSSDGGALTTNEAVNFEVQVSTNLAGTNWLRLNVPLTVTNGQIVFEDGQSGSLPRRFYRVIER